MHILLASAADSSRAMVRESRGLHGTSRAPTRRACAANAGPLNVRGRAVTLRDALAIALTLDVFHRHAAKLLQANFMGLINQEGEAVLGRWRSVLGDADLLCD